MESAAHPRLRRRLEPHEIPLKPSVFDDEPGKTGGRSAVRTGDAARIQPAYSSSIGFVARHVRMSVQHHLGTRRRPLRWNMHEVKTHALTLEIQGQRPRVRIAIAGDDREGALQFFERAERRRRTDVAEVPDFIRLTEPSRQVRRIPVVRVRNDGDPHCYSRHGFPER